MAAMRIAGILIALLAAPLAFADVASCTCDPGDPLSMAARECGLSREAAAQPSDLPMFFLKDTNPRKPNRWLALPSVVRKGVHNLAGMTPQERLQLWTASIRKAQELWGDEWGLAFNGDSMRTQCQPHVHIGKLLKGVETNRFVVVSRPAEIPLPAEGTGLWIHPQGKQLHVHVGEQLTETVLLR
jgi:hypothetical protein